MFLVLEWELIFPQIVYSMNPYNLLEGISYCFGDVSKFKDDKMESFVEIMDIEQINSEIKNVINVIKNPKFKELKKFLNNIEISLESFPFHQEDMVPNDNGKIQKEMVVCMKKISIKVNGF